MSSVKIVRYLPLFVSHSKTSLPNDNDQLIIISGGNVIFHLCCVPWLYSLQPSIIPIEYFTCTTIFLLAQRWHYRPCSCGDILYLLWVCSFLKNFSPDIENGIEYRYFSRYSVKVRKSSIVTDNTTRNAIVIIQLELQET